MRQSLLQSRPVHYLSLSGLLLSVVLGGFVSLRCTSYTVPSGSPLAGQAGVRHEPKAGISLDAGDANVTHADYQLSPTIKINRFGSTQEVPCTWRAVRSLRGLSTARSLADFDAADTTDVEILPSPPNPPNTARIKKDESRNRTTRFVCEFEFLGQTRLRSHSVRVTNF